MKRGCSGLSPRRLWFRAALAWVGVIAALASSAFAKDHPPKATGSAAEVVGHIALQGTAATQMFLQDQGGKQFLYLDQGAKQGFTVVDVTKSSEPLIVRHIDSAKIHLLGGDAGLSEAPDTNTSNAQAESPKIIVHSHPSTETVNLLDLTDPANPRTVQTFKGVTAILHEDRRSLIYLTNADGLWVLKHAAPSMQPAARKKACDSESAISAMPPDCE